MAMFLCSPSDNQRPNRHKITYGKNEHASEGNEFHEGMGTQVYGERQTGEAKRRPASHVLLVRLILS